MKSAKLTIGAVLVAFAVTGCANMTDTQQKTATGAGIGAAVGALAGAATGPGGWKRAAIGGAIGAAIGGGAGYVWGAQMEKQKQELTQAYQNTDVAVSQTADNQLKLNVPGDLSFATNSAQISAQGRTVLTQLANSLKTNPGTTVKVYGYTDSTGSNATNQALSEKRAASVKSFLVSQGVSSSRISTAGMGSSNPVADNSTAQGRLLNRRVEVYIGQAAQ